MKTLILQYADDSEINTLISKTLEIEQSSKASLARRAIINYCRRILQNGTNTPPQTNEPDLLEIARIERLEFCKLINQLKAKLNVHLPFGKEKNRSKIAAPVL